MRSIITSNSNYFFQTIKQILEENHTDYDTNVTSTPLPESRESISDEERIPLCTIEPMQCLVEDEILKSVEKNNRKKVYKFTFKCKIQKFISLHLYNNHKSMIYCILVGC